MKRKYFVRGLGVGILFGALIMFAAYMTSGIGFCEINFGSVTLLNFPFITHVPSPTSRIRHFSRLMLSKVLKVSRCCSFIPVNTATTEAPTTTEKATTEKTTTEKATTEASTTEKADTSTQTTVTISSGMSSEAIASALANAGLVDDASKFNSFLVANGYDMKLETGNFSLETGMSYEEIAKILTTKQ